MSVASNHHPVKLERGLHAEASDFLRSLVGCSGPGRVSSAVALMLLSGVVEGLGLMLLLPVLRLASDAGAPPDAASQWLARMLQALGQPFALVPALGLLTVLLSCSALLEWCRDVSAADLQIRFVTFLRMQSMAAIAGASWGYLCRQPMARLQSVLCRDMELLRQAVLLSLQLCVTMLLLAANVAVALFIAPWLAVVVLVLGLPAAWGLARVTRQAQAWGRQVEWHQGQLQGEVVNFLNVLKLSKCVGAEQRHVQAFNTGTGELQQALQRMKSYGTGLRAALHVGVALAVGGLLLALQQGRWLSLSDVTVLVIVVVRVVTLLRSAYPQVRLLGTALPVHANIVRLLRECRAHAEPEAVAEHGIRLQQELRLEHVSYRHGGEPHAAIDGVSLRVPAGSVLALLGPSGAGKTTLADMMLGLMTPDSGRVLVDGVSLEGPALLGWRHSVGYVPQESLFLNASIRENLAWSSPASESEMLQALEAAQALDFVLRRPGGLDSRIGDHGRELSGGERQRLALARALLRRPSLLVLDEPTSALDEANAGGVYQAIERLRGRMTIVVVAHDANRLVHADQLAYLARGRVVRVESGLPGKAGLLGRSPA